MANSKFDSKSFNAEAFKYMVGRVPNLKMNELKKSRALAGNPDIRAVFANQEGTAYARLAIANDVALVFNTRYLGFVPNDAAGRISLWNDICKLLQELEEIRAIVDFDTDNVTIAQGETKKSVLCTISNLTIINAMAQLYMSVVIR